MGVGTVTFGAAATMTVANGAIHNPGRVLNNAGTINWTGGNFCVGDGATLNNTSAFNDQSTNGFALYNCYGGAAPRGHNARGGKSTRLKTPPRHNSHSVPFLKKKKEPQ